MTTNLTLPAKDILEDAATQPWPAYPEYKDSGVGWLGEIPIHWEVKRLKNVAQLNSEVLAETTDPNYELQYVDISNVDSDGNVLEAQEMQFENAPSRARRKVRKGDTIVSTVRTYLRAIAFINEPPDNLIVSTGFAVLRPLSGVHPQFLFRLTQSQEFVEKVVAYSEGVSYPAINPSRLACLPVWLPPLPEQHAIATFLDRETAKIDQLITKKERLIALLQEKRTALISQVVTKGLDPNALMKDSGVEWLGAIPAHWDVKRFKHCCVIKEGQVDPRDDRLNSRVLIAPNHIESGTGRILFTETAAEQQAMSGKYLVETGELIYSKIRPALNKVCIAEGDWLCSADMYPVRVKRHLRTRFLLYFLLSEPFVRLMIDESMRVAMPKVNRETLTACPLLVPPENEQVRIIPYLDGETTKLDAIIAKTQQHIEKLREYRMAVISAAVTGKIDVRGEVHADSLSL